MVCKIENWFLVFVHVLKSKITTFPKLDLLPKRRDFRFPDDGQRPETN